MFFQRLHETPLRVDAAEAEPVAVRGGGHVEFQIPTGKRRVEGNRFPRLTDPEMPGAEHREGGGGVVGSGFVREPVRVCGGIDAVEFDSEEIGVLVAGEIEQEIGEVFDKGKVVVFVEENVGVGAVAEPIGGEVEEFAVALFFALMVGGEVGGFGEVDFVGMGDSGEVGGAAAVGEEDVVGCETSGLPDGEDFSDGVWCTVVEKDDGLWLYTLNMDMMVKMGRKLPSPLKEEARAVRDTIYEMMERASKGEI